MTWKRSQAHKHGYTKFFAQSGNHGDVPFAKVLESRLVFGKLAVERKIYFEDIDPRFSQHT